MDEVSNQLVDFLEQIPTGKQMKQQGLYCQCGIVAEWCATHKHDNPASIRVVLREENLKIAENLDTWLKKPRTT